MNVANLVITKVIICFQFLYGILERLLQTSLSLVFSSVVRLYSSCCISSSMRFIIVSYILKNFFITYVIFCLAIEIRFVYRIIIFDKLETPSYTSLASSFLSGPGFTHLDMFRVWFCPSEMKSICSFTEDTNKNNFKNFQ